ncbi:MAG: hypothetical protein KBD90_04930 [Alphaproteobacteria bacterium]|nr:hypothetical protein [Alphaproteobacteria bacterium]
MNNIGILSLSTNLSKDLKERLPKQRKKQRESLSLLTATMLLVRSPKLPHFHLKQIE